MRINKFVAQATGLSRRSSDEAIAQGRVLVNGHPPTVGQNTLAEDHVTFDGKQLTLQTTQTILLHKPVGYVVSRDGQGSKTIYELLPQELHSLKPVGRLDKDSSGLLLLTNDGILTQRLTHPSFQKQKVYEIKLIRPLPKVDYRRITEQGVQLEDGVSKLSLKPLDSAGYEWLVAMHEGRNRQIRRTFLELGYRVIQLHRLQFGDYTLGEVQPGKFSLMQ